MMRKQNIKTLSLVIMMTFIIMLTFCPYTQARVHELNVDLYIAYTEATPLPTYAEHLARVRLSLALKRTSEELSKHYPVEIKIGPNTQIIPFRFNPNDPESPIIHKTYGGNKYTHLPLERLSKFSTWSKNHKNEGKMIILSVDFLGPDEYYYGVANPSIGSIAAELDIQPFAGPVRTDPKQTLGHEIGHILGLDHSRNPDNLMGYGNKGGWGIPKNPSKYYIDRGWGITKFENFINPWTLSSPGGEFDTSSSLTGDEEGCESTEMMPGTYCLDTPYNHSEDLVCSVKWGEVRPEWEAKCVEDLIPVGVPVDPPPGECPECTGPGPGGNEEEPDPDKCGNNQIDPGEECGEPNLNQCQFPTEECNFDTCKCEKTCGNGTIELWEECGEPGFTCPGDDEFCLSCLCYSAPDDCGNGVLEREKGEECDPPGTVCLSFIEAATGFGRQVLCNEDCLCPVPDVYPTDIVE